jgi:hypothetical protein
VTLGHAAPVTVEGVPNPPTDSTERSGGAIGEKTDEPNTSPETDIGQKALHGIER